MSQSYGYDSKTGRLQSASQGGNTATYGYWPSSNLVSSVVMDDGSQDVFTHSKAYDDPLRRVSEVSNSNGGVLQSFDLSYDNRGRINRVDREDGSY